MTKKILAMVVIVVGALMLVGGVAPMVIGAILELQMASTVDVIGGADGPTAVIVVGSLGTGQVIGEIAVGILLIASGIWGYIRGKR